MVNNNCLKLLTDYDLVRSMSSGINMSVVGVTADQAGDMCSSVGGSLAELGSETFQMFKTFLTLWRHDEHTGNIWTKSSYASGLCNIIKVCNILLCHAFLYSLL